MKVFVIGVVCSQFILIPLRCEMYLCELKGVAAPFSSDNIDNNREVTQVKKFNENR